MMAAVLSAANDFTKQTTKRRVWDKAKKKLTCIVSSCRACNTDFPDLSFFRFPKSPQSCQEWIHSINQPGLEQQITSNTRVCGLHFHPQAFCPAAKRLKKTSKPTEFGSRFEIISLASIHGYEPSDDDDQQTDKVLHNSRELSPRPLRVNAIRKRDFFEQNESEDHPATPVEDLEVSVYSKESEDHSYALVDDSEGSVYSEESEDHSDALVEDSEGSLYSEESEDHSDTLIEDLEGCIYSEESEDHSDTLVEDVDGSVYSGGNSGPVDHEKYQSSNPFSRSQTRQGKQEKKNDPRKLSQNKHQEEVAKLKWENINLQKELSQNKSQKEEVTKLRREKRNLQRKLSRQDKRHQEEVAKYKKVIKEIENRNSEQQEKIRVAKAESKYGKRWTESDQVLAIVIYCQSPRAYTILKKKLLLPHTRTINRWLKGLQIKPGFQTAFLDVKKSRVSKTSEMEKVCTLLIDEITVKKGLLCDESNDLGLEDCDIVDGSKEVAKAACKSNITTTPANQILQIKPTSETLASLQV